MSTALSKVASGFVVAPANSAELWTFCQTLAKSDMVPSCYRNKPENVFLAVQLGGELGLAPMQAIQNIAPINGRPAVWGDAQLALCLPHLDSFEEGGDANARWCKATRGNRKSEHTFSMEDARRAKLTEKKDTPWQTYPERMLQQRARSWVLRDLCPDILRGIAQAEEASDYEVRKDQVRADVLESKPAEQPPKQLSEPKREERKSTPPPAAATVFVPVFAQTFPNKRYAGHPLASCADLEILQDYKVWLEAQLDDPRKAKKAQAALDVLADEFARRIDAETGEVRDPIAEGLDAEVQRQREERGEGAASYLDGDQ